MSHKVVSLVYSRVVGSSVRKCVLAYMADRASDDGRGVFCSKQTIANETEFGRSTIIRTCNEFVAEGILIASGTRKCANGATVEYDLNLDAIAALPLIKQDHKPSQSGTSPDMDQSQSGTPLVPERDPTSPAAGPQAVPERDPNHPRTILEPSLNLYPCDPQPEDAKPKKVKLPSGWVPSDDDHAFALSLNLLPAEIEEIANDFHGYWTERTDANSRKTGRGWAQAWRNRCRDVAPQFIRNRRGTRTNQHQSTPHRGNGGAHEGLLAGFATVASRYTDRG